MINENDQSGLCKNVAITSSKDPTISASTSNIPQSNNNTSILLNGIPNEEQLTLSEISTSALTPLSTSYSLNFDEYESSTNGLTSNEIIPAENQMLLLRDQNDNSEVPSSYSSLEVNISSIDVELPRNNINITNVSLSPFPGWLIRMFPNDDYLSRGDNLNVNPHDDLNETSSASTLEADDEDENNLQFQPTSITISQNDSGIVDSLDDTFYDTEPIRSNMIVETRTAASLTVNNIEIIPIDSSSLSAP